MALNDHGDNGAGQISAERADKSRAERADKSSAERAGQISAGRAATCACFFDFDGTLAPIQDDPEAVLPVPGAVEALKELASRVSRVAIVSARPVGFLNRHFTDLPEIARYGLYGLESQVGSGPVWTHPDAARFEPVMAELAARAEAELPERVLVEYKRVSVALHYRAEPALRPVVEEWASQRTAELGLHAQPGRMVVELKPPGTRDKGSVVSELIRDMTCAWYFGDDLSDLQAYQALDERQAADPSFVGFRVAVVNSESGAALSAAADLTIGRPEQVPAFLKDLVDALGPATP